MNTQEPDWQREALEADRLALQGVRELTCNKLRGVEITSRKCRLIGMPRFAKVGEPLNGGDTYELIIVSPHPSCWIIGRKQFRFLS